MLAVRCIFFFFLNRKWVKGKSVYWKTVEKNLSKHSTESRRDKNGKVQLKVTEKRLRGFIFCVTGVLEEGTGQCGGRDI